jgi:hypothetical protein
MGTFGHEGGGALNDDQRDALRSVSMVEEIPIEPASEMQHVAGSVLRQGRARANEYGAELVVIAIEREPKSIAALEALPAPGYAFGMASTSDDDETIALALRAIARRLERA